MTAAEKKIIAFCTRHGLACEWQSLKYNGRRAVVKSLNRDQHYITLKATRRLKGIRVEDWTCGAGGVWDGYIFFQDAADAERIDAILTAERQRHENWCIANHYARLSGMNLTDSAQYAENLYPTPSTL